MKYNCIFYSHYTDLTTKSFIIIKSNKIRSKTLSIFRPLRHFPTPFPHNHSSDTIQLLNSLGKCVPLPFKKIVQYIIRSGKKSAQTNDKKGRKTFKKFPSLYCFYLPSLIPQKVEERHNYHHQLEDLKLNKDSTL